MSIRGVKGKVDDKIPIRNVLISVSNKDKLDVLVSGLIHYQDVILFSTGGTYAKIKDMLSATDLTKGRLVEIARYTQMPEMEGGLVKTLHPKVHAGILGERNNPEHIRYLKEGLNSAVFFDMVVVNLYPFERVIADPNVSFEGTRGNIDIGGPAMLRGAAKNFLYCAAVCQPEYYDALLTHINANNGSTLLAERLCLASETFKVTAEYDAAIAKHLNEKIMASEGRGLGRIVEGYLNSEGV